MTAHHHISEENIIDEGRCPYCNRVLDTMQFVHELDRNYREVTCECKRKVQVRVGPGSGHDDFNKNLGKNLDSRVENK